MKKKINKRVLSIPEILSEAWNRFTENFRLILILTLVIYIPINIILYFIPIETGEDFITYIRVAQVLEGLIGIIALMGIAYAVKNSLDRKPITPAKAFHKAISRWGQAIVTNIIFGVLIFLLALLLIVPAIIFMVYWVFSSYIVVLTDKWGKEALDYSKSIVKGRWWLVLGYSLTFAIMSFGVGIIGGIPGFFLPYNLFTSVAIETLIDLLLSFFVVVSTIFYINFEATKSTEQKQC